MKTEMRDTFDRVFWAVCKDNEWGWGLAAVDALRDAILCLENDNPGGAWSYINEADGYLDLMREGVVYVASA